MRGFDSRSRLHGSRFGNLFFDVRETPLLVFRRESRGGFAMTVFRQRNPLSPVVFFASMRHDGGNCPSGGMVYTGDLKSPAARIVGSTPTSGTRKRSVPPLNGTLANFTLILYYGTVQAYTLYPISLRSSVGRAARS